MKFSKACSHIVFIVKKNVIVSFHTLRFWNFLNEGNYMASIFVFTVNSFANIRRWNFLGTDEIINVIQKRLI